MDITPVQYLGAECGNKLYIKREDLIPFSFGGNKARKAILFFGQIDREGHDSVVTYGSSSSNHCRVVANMACRRGIQCHIISPSEQSEITSNSRMMELFGAHTTTVPVERVHDTIEAKLEELRARGNDPYFIPGGGHGNIGTEAYVNCYDEIVSFEEQNDIRFDHIFHASGTGTTQAGLICGKLLREKAHRIIGISIARKNPRGRDIVLESVRDYLGDGLDAEKAEESAVFIDDYTHGYAGEDRRVNETVAYVLKKYGIPLDPVYTGKAFAGMIEYLKENRIENKNVLFIHTGGTPLFFDVLDKL